MLALIVLGAAMLTVALSCLAFIAGVTATSTALQGIQSPLLLCVLVTLSGLVGSLPIAFILPRGWMRDGMLIAWSALWSLTGWLSIFFFYALQGVVVKG